MDSYNQGDYLRIYYKCYIIYIIYCNYIYYIIISIYYKSISEEQNEKMNCPSQYARLEAPEREFDKPQWIQPFADVDNVGEGQVNIFNYLNKINNYLFNENKIRKIEMFCVNRSPTWRGTG